MSLSAKKSSKRIQQKALCCFYLMHSFEVSKFEVLISMFFWACFSKPPDLHVMGVGRSACDIRDVGAMLNQLSFEGTKGTRGQVLIDSLDQYPRSASWSVLNRHPDRCLVDTLLPLDQQIVDSLPSADQLICINQKLVNSLQTVNQGVDGVLIECEQRFWGNVDWVRTGVLRKCRLSIDWVLIKFR